MSFESDRRPTLRPSDAPKEARERPPPYADPWRETPTKEDDDEPSESFQRLYDIFAHPSRRTP